MSESINQNLITSSKSKSSGYFKILLIPIILTFALCGGMAWYILDLYNSFKLLETREFKILNLSNQITYLDEVLSSSARLAATTGDKRWEKRYLDFVPQLDNAIAETEALVPSIFENKDAISQTDEANNKLIAMEDRAFELINQGKLEEATSLLLSSEYEQQKAIYAEGLEKTTNALRNYVQTIVQNKSRLTFSGLTTIAIGFSILLFAWILVLRRTQKYIQAINDLETLISQTSTEMSATVDRQEEIISQQASAVNNTTVTIDRLGFSSKESAQRAEDSAAGASEALSLAENGSQTIQQTLTGMENLKMRVREIAEQIMNLSEQTGQISTISELVEDVANQTNILALRASVEAARVGEEGKGFGVVADEIRKLADESRSSANTINNLVAEIQAAMNSAVMVTDEGKKTAETSIQLAEDTAQTFVNVKNSINNIFSNSQEIFQNTKQQAVSIQDIMSTINAINLDAQDTAVGITQVKTSATQLQDFAEKLKAII
ncbi:methyl-accepting chemotaxis protein [Pleurocapsa sp. PCC 7319]|uniref:methyl-accepting chemotaxis protein n=1 Tax=Pleurocapsa sp. PCC 7319 TaxID=118161 RepID=UPI000346FFF6|nr:methyl-accepting chemotaxis protein [Pleurocapsa sp. PCC 7319]